MNLRKATAHDAAALSDLVFRSKASNGYDDAFMDACRDELAVTHESLLVGDWWLVESGKLLGCCQLTVDAGNGTVEAFFVSPDAQRQGVGRLLWQKLLDRASELQLDRLQLDADPSAVGFYERLGFRTTGSVPSGSIPGRWLPRMAFVVPALTRDVPV